MPRSKARLVAATTARTDIAPGTPEEAYQAINSAKMLWGFRLRDVDSWQDVIERWTNTKPEAWKRIPEDGEKYGSPRRMIETELETDYEQFKEFVRIVLGTKYAALIDEPLSTHGGKRNEWGRNGKPKNQDYLDNLDSGKKQQGTSSAYLRQRIKDEYPDELENIGNGKKYKTVKEAAREMGMVTREIRYSLPDDPEAAGRYLAQRVDREWGAAMVETYMKEIA